MRYLCIGKNDLLTWCKEHGERGKLLMKEWDSEKNYGNVCGWDMQLGMENVMFNTTLVKCDWICSECGEEFQMTPRARTVDGQGCRKCGKKRAGLKNHQNALKENNLHMWCMENGEFGKILLEEWDTEKNRKELGKEITDVTAGTNKKVYWICSKCGRSYEKEVSYRVACRGGCKNCNKFGTSFPEQLIFMSLKQIYSDIKNREKLFENVEYDIYIPSENFCIEYSGVYWHANRKEKDEFKRQLCEKNNMRFLQIYGSGKIQQNEFSETVIKYGIYNIKHHSQLYEIIQYIVEMLGHKIEEIDFNKALDDTCIFMYQEVENNLAEQYPELVKEWDYEKNHYKKPEHFTRGAREVIHWKCSHCGNKWEVSIKSRVRFRTGCKKCGYNVFDKKIHVRAIQKSKVSFQLGRYSL